MHTPIKSQTPPWVTAAQGESAGGPETIEPALPFFGGDAQERTLREAVFKPRSILVRQL